MQQSPQPLLLLPQAPQQTQLFLLKTPHKFPLPHQYDKILGYCPMYANTCVILAIKSHCLQCVAHIDENGKILKQLLFQDADFYQYVITSDKQIVWVDVDRNCILQWNLETYQLLEVGFQYVQDCDTHNIYVFPDSQLICILQCSRQNNPTLKLSYFSYPLTPNSKPVHQLQVPQNQPSQYLRGNTKSMIILFKPQQQQSITFTTVQLQLGYKNQYKQKITVHKVMVYSQSITIGSIWEMNQTGKYMIVCIGSNVGASPMLVYEESTGVLRESRVRLRKENYFRVVDFMAWGKTSMVRTFRFVDGKSQQSQIFYIDNQNQCISARDSWTCTNLNKYTFPAYDANMLIDAKYQNGNVGSIESQSVRVVCPRQLIVDMLICVVGERDVEEDLLSQVCSLIFGN